MKTKLTEMKKRISRLAIAAFSLTIILFGGCKKEAGTFTVLLTDAPATYQEVNVEILKVKVHIDATQNKKAGWYELNTNAGVYDLLKLQNVTTTLAVGESLPAGDLTQISLILGTNHSVKDSAGQTHPLLVPGGSESGIKIIGQQLVKNEDGKITLDFDAKQSVVNAVTGYILKPVITVL